MLYRFIKYTSIFAICLVVSGLVSGCANSNASASENRYIPLHSSAYRLTAKNKHIYAFAKPGQKKNKIKLNKTMYLSANYVITDRDNLNGEQGKGCPVQLGKAKIKLGKKQGYLPVMLADRANLEKYTNGTHANAARQLWTTRMFINSKNVKITKVESTNLYKYGLAKQLLIYDNAGRRISKSESNDDSIDWIPVYLMMQSSSDENESEMTNDNISSANSDSANNADDDNNEENSNTEDSDSDADTNSSDDDATTTDDTAETDTTTAGEE